MFGPRTIRISFLHVLSPIVVKLALFFLVIGCTGGPTISGVVQLGRVKDATVKVHKIEKGEKGELVATTTTNSSGEFNASVPIQTEPLLVVSSGGS